MAASSDKTASESDKTAVVREAVTAAREIEHRTPTARKLHRSCVKTPPLDPVQARPLRVLLIDDGAHRVALIRDELTRQGHEVVGVIDSAIVVHECVTRLLPDVIIIDSVSPSRDAFEHIATLAGSTPRPVVVFAEDDSGEPMQRAMRAGVSAYVVAGLQPQRLASVLKVAIARFEQASALREQLVQAEAQLSSRRVIERAKAILMQQGGLGEDAAHRQLRKLAMDRGEKLAPLAERIIEAHGLLHPSA